VKKGIRTALWSHWPNEHLFNHCPKRLYDKYSCLKSGVKLFQVGFRFGLLVRTSLFGWWTFLDLCLIYGWQVTTLWTKCPLWINQPGQLCLPSLQWRPSNGG